MRVTKFAKSVRTTAIGDAESTMSRNALLPASVYRAGFAKPWWIPAA